MFQLACPICKTPFLGDSYSCYSCQSQYGKLNSLDIPNLVPKSLQFDPRYRFEAKRYDRIATNGAKNYTGLAFTAEQLRAKIAFEFVKNSGQDEWIEIGPGFGTLQRMAVGYPSLAIDYSINFLKYLDSLTLGSMELVRGAAEYLPLEDESVSCLVADSVFQSMVDREMFLCELSRVCQPGAKILVTIAYAWNYLRRPQNGFNILRQDEFETLGRYLNELGFLINYHWMEIEKGVEVTDKEHGNYLYIHGTKQ